jgi:hypothetical protein
MTDRMIGLPVEYKIRIANEEPALNEFANI